ncbi:MAG: exonuclease domain-containing protein [Actinomycetaceae bacterium]|nr:hypothetical protein [Arcanobacterium sp.]MDD7687061.1 exonuclease domain-containing protein [Actinomycetaceae bacterium]MDY5273281.1 exonuclease domain-containing protein [Arcanobacterium sp.]
MSATNYRKKIIDDYCVLDTETTGLSAYYDEVIELGILRVRGGTVVDQYSQLIHPEHPIDGFITALTGITNEMLAGMPSISEVKDAVLSFVGDDVIVGHNILFDIRFLNMGFGDEIENEYMDTMQFARKMYPELDHHRLSDLRKHLGLSNNEHRAIADCITTQELYETIKATMSDKGLQIKDLWAENKRGSHSVGVDISSIIPNTVEVNEESFFYDRHVVFTGKLEKMARKNAMQIVVNLGGILDTSVTKRTNYLILGDNDYNTILHGEKSSKHKKAEKLKLEGNDIEIIDEFTFYDILSDEGVLA